MVLKTLCVKIEPELIEFLDAYAEAHGLNRSEALRRILEDKKIRWYRPYHGKYLTVW